MEIIQTERLWGFPMTAAELKVYISPDPHFGQHRNLQPSLRPLEPEVLELFEQGILPLLASTPEEDHVWYTAWCMVETASQLPIGDFCFYSPPIEEGWTEIGYGIYPQHQSQGYMTEFMGGIIAWCQQFPSLKILKARTQTENLPSIRMLESLGFECKGNDPDECLLWERTM